MSSQNPGTHPDRDEKSGKQQGQFGSQDEQDKDQKQGTRKDSSRGKGDNQGGSSVDSDRARKPGQKSGQS
jgi:hypothetical protein